jgi:hypothetical protein
MKTRGAALQFTQSIAAGATFDPLETWNMQYVKRPGFVKLNHNATAVGLLCTFTSGTDQIFQESPVPAGGVSGVIPSDYTVPPVIDRVDSGDRLSLRYRNPTGGAIIVNGNIDYTPGRGGR